MTRGGAGSRFAALGLVLGLQGCGTLTSLDALQETRAVPQAKTEVIVTPPPTRVAAHAIVDQFALMALFAKVVYRKDLPEKGNEVPGMGKERLRDGCAYLEPGAEVPDFGMPKSGTGAWGRLAEKAIESCYNAHGLYYETYVHTPRKGGPPDRAVIAIRGTENWNVADFMRDWSSNLAAVFGLDPAEYRLAREKIRTIANSLKGRYPGISIYTTGHSLGGGIAQQMAYASKKVSAAYAFDPSPVTNWSWLVLNKEIKQDDPTIVRVYHLNEALAYVRNITTRFNTRRFGRSDYEFHFQSEPPVQSHEMGILACHFATRIGPADADFGFSKQSADEILAPNYHREKGMEHPVCSEGIMDLPYPYDTRAIAGRRH